MSALNLYYFWPFELLQVNLQTWRKEADEKSGKGRQSKKELGVTVSNALMAAERHIITSYNYSWGLLSI